ncbi:adhesion G-protein coupled receptor G4 isoform X1 [Ctenopharyngodon idella]|uniref:adhesion G-protein coupled receptor G4 isoform X1 n=1 Tax=Ctenopharyngodon idella TaxID=7959 RepID=UPI00222F3064|nr:adhesion G-protein coupled receptor G4 isoform X1 [Ctenopharyngodon idella]
MHTFKKYLPVTIYIWIFGSSLICSGSSLWGKKMVFSTQCVWQLNKNVIIPPLEELSVCVNLMKKYITYEWTAFDYKGPGQQHMELGLAGNGGNLKASLFGKEWIVAYDLHINNWYTVCLTWSSHTRLFQMIVNQAIFEFHLNETSPRFLAANGTLTLGVSHSFVGGAIVFETGKNFLGDMSLFRMWGVQLSPLQLDEFKCVDGNIMTWRTQDWDNQKCPAIEDNSLKCVSSKYKIQMNTSITQNTNDDNAENDVQEIVLHWLKHIFPWKISVHSMFLSNLSPQTEAGLPGQNKENIQDHGMPTIKTQWFDCVVFVKVIPEDDVGKTVSEIQGLLIPIYNYSENISLITNPDSINILSVAVLPNVTLNPAVTAPVLSQTTKSPDIGSANITISVSRTSLQTRAMENICSATSGLTSHRDFEDIFYRVYLNLTMSGSITDPKQAIQQWLQETLQKCKMDVLNLVLKGAPKYITTFQVQSSASVNATAAERLIFELLTKGYTNATISISVPTGEVKVNHIDPGHCPEEFMLTVYGIYTWPAMTAQSQYDMGCEQGDESATRFCKLNGATDRAVWDPPDMSKCIRTVDFDYLENITVTADNSADIVDMIGDLLREQNGLNGAQLHIVLEKLSKVTEVGTLTKDLSSSITNIVSDICNIKTDLTQVTNKILYITDLMGDRTVFTGDAHNMTAPSLALQLINPDTSQFHGLTFEVSSIQNDSIPEIFYDENFTEHPDTGTLAFISLPPAIESFFPNNGARPRVQFHFYGKEKFFEDPTINMALNSYVVSASVTNATVSHLEIPVMVTLRHLENKEDQDTAKCVYWDFNKNNEKGGWNNTGCETMKSNATHTSCSCDHLTHFGVLLDISKTPINPKDERILTVISYLGSGISSIFLGVTLLTYLSFEKLRRDYPSKILINLSVALLGLNMLFLVNSWFASFNSNALCITVAAFLHYFFLATFTWMGLGAINMYLALVKVFNSYVPSYILKFCALGWGLPLLVVSLVLAIDVNSYGAGLSRAPLQEEPTAFCWLRNDVTFYVTVVSFVTLIMVCNICMFAVVLVQIRKMHVNKPASNRKGFLHDLRVVASLTFLLGLTWTLAFVAWGPAKTPLLYLFSLLNSLQGFFIFLFYCLMKDNVRKQWRIHLCCGRFRRNEYSDWSRSVTAGAKAKDGQHVSSPSMKSETTSERKISDTSNSGASHDGVFLTQDRKQ